MEHPLFNQQIDANTCSLMSTQELNIFLKLFTEKLLSRLQSLIEIIKASDENNLSLTENKEFISLMELIKTELEIAILVRNEFKRRNSGETSLDNTVHMVQIHMNSIKRKRSDVEDDYSKKQRMF